jgi:hypothetical protein
MSANPIAAAAVVLVAAVGEAEGARGAAAALACAGADADLATLLVDIGGKAPRPTLLASTAAQRLEERLAAHLPAAWVAARGQVCHLAVAADPDGLATAAAAATVARGALAVLHLPPALLQPLLVERLGPDPTGVLLRADIAADRPLLALVVRDLIARDLAVAVLKQRLSWVVERRALFGSLGPGTAGGLPPRLLRRLAPREVYPELESSQRANTGTAFPAGAAAAVRPGERSSR